MAKIVMLEELAPDVQCVFEELLASKEPIIFARDGQPLGCMEAYEMSTTVFAELTPEEEADIMADIRQSEADFAAGRYITLEEFKVKYAAKLQEDEV